MVQILLNSMPIYRVIVRFEVEAEPIGPWSAKECALDYVRHRIDEGQRQSEFIKSWQLIDVLERKRPVHKAINSPAGLPPGTNPNPS